MSRIDYQKVAEYVKIHHPNIVNEKLKVAHNVMNNTFLFDMPHDLERTTEPVHFGDKIDWEYVLNGDKEFAYQLARNRYFVDLAEAYYLTGKSEYVKRIVDIWTDFIRRAPYRKGSLAWRTLETGLRGEYWTRTLDMIRDSEYVTDDFMNMVRASLEEHAKVLKDEKIDHHRFSNWGVLQDHGLFDIALELGNEEYQRLALDRLYEESNLQLMADGVHWEVSTTYHNEVLGCFVDTMIRAREHDIELDKHFLRNVRAMADVNMYWVKPNRNGPLYGDSDVLDLRGMLSTTALLFNDSCHKYIAGRDFDYDNAWRLGLDAINSYEGIEPQVPSFGSKSLSDSGNYIMRSSYDEDANYLIFHNGNTGGGHAHEDKLSFELSISGRDVLVDTGRYSYVWNKERKELKSYKAHNTTSVDNRHFVRAFGWDYIGTIIPSIKEEMILHPDFEMVRGTHNGYVGRLKGSITTTRSILWLKNDVYIVIDEFFGKGNHTYNGYYNFAPHASLDMKGDSVIATCEGVKTLLKFMDKGIKVEKEKGLFSHHYNAIEDIDRVKTTLKGKANAHMVTVIVGNPDKYNDLKIENVVVKDAYENAISDTAAVRITIDGNVYELIMQFSEHIKLLHADDKVATGKFTLYKNGEYNAIKW